LQSNMRNYNEIWAQERNEEGILGGLPPGQGR
jgi:hypothetical protein